MDYYDGSANSIPYGAKEIDAAIDYVTNSTHERDKSTTIERLRAVKTLIHSDAIE